MADKRGHVQMLDPSLEFRPEKVIDETGWNFRTFKEKSEDKKLQEVFNTYKLMHTIQCVDYVKQRQEQWCKFHRFRGTVLEVLEKLNNLVDKCDPDTDLPNIVHAFQTAEMIREAHPDKDWLQLTGLIHDLGKVMALYGEPQYSTVGDNFPVGCAFGPSIVFRDSTFDGNPDLNNEKYNTKYGMYTPNCGLRNVMMSWGHDEYMYRVLQHNNTTLPMEALYIVRFHSFYPWHSSGDYKHLTDNFDEEMLPWVNEFNKFDLYTKKGEIPDIEKLKPYYQKLIDKYIPGELYW